MIAFALQFGRGLRIGDEMRGLGLRSHLDLHSHLLLINFVCRRSRKSVGVGEAKRNGERLIKVPPDKQSTQVVKQKKLAELVGRRREEAGRVSDERVGGSKRSCPE